ncbi:MAG: serine/threonine protein kinase [Verrucomicrobiales bacterium]|nr:serine/threonine protein kinase [Verrucomicrobiales bacterium]
MPADETAPEFFRLAGLDPARVLHAAQELPDLRTDEVPTVEDLGALLPEYEVQEMIGRGGMGAVYRAVQRKLARPVAIKVLPVEMGDAAGFALRFRREAMTTAGIIHPDIVAVHDAGETVAGHHYYVMDLVDGEDLARRMARGRLPVEQCVTLLAAVCNAVEAAHAAGIIHRDIKPSNILLTKDGAPKLADFGLALLTEKHLEYSRLTLGGTTLGTLEYAAPEQLAGAEVTAASDIYSLGVLAYELLTGELPRGVFDPPSVRNPEIDSAFDGVVLRALQSDPARRHGSAAEFRTALLQAADRRIREERRRAEALRKLRRRTGLAAMTGTAALLTFGLAIFAWQQRKRAEAGEAEANQRSLAANAAQKETEDVIHFLLTDLRQRLERIGNLGAMESVLERAEKHFREKCEASPGSADAVVQLADALVIKAGVLAARGLPDEAVALLGEAKDLAETARSLDPKNRERQSRVVQAWKHLSEQLLGMGKFQPALDAARQMLREAESIQNPPAPRDAAAAHRACANALGYLEQLDQCHAEYLKAQEILTAKAKTHPEDQATKDDLAALDMSLGSLAEERKDYPLMLRHFTAWHQFVKQTHGTDGSTYSHAAVRLALALVLNQRAAEAQPLLTDAIRIAEADVDARPGHRGRMGHLRQCMVVYALMQDQRGESASAAEMRRRISAIDAAIAATPEEDAAGSMDRVADRLQKTEQRLFAELKKNPENPAAQYAWAMASEDLGKHIDSIEGIPSAMQHYQRQMARLEPLLSAAPADSWWNLGASYTLNRLGELKERTRDWAGAEPVFRRSFDLRCRTQTAHPGSPREPRNMVSTASRLARCFLNQNRPAEAEALWLSLLEQLKSDASTGLEWRALIATSIQETLPALTSDAARSLAAKTCDFFLVRGEASLSAAEKDGLHAMKSLATKATAPQR